MQNYQLLIKKIKKIFDILQQESFFASQDGTHHKVFLSKRYAIRFRDDNSELLLREGDFLQKFSHPLIPKVLWLSKLDGLAVIVENRLPGKTIDSVWKTLSISNKTNIIKQIVQFLQYLRSQKRDYVYSVKAGKRYKNFLNYLIANINQKIANLKKFKQTSKIIKDLLLIINNPKTKNLFINKKGTALVHGDLIIHNLLTNNKNLTGVLDWELSLFGDPDYDLFRLFYYQECAKAYQEQGIDETFEANFMDRLITAILKSDIIKNQKIFREKYYFVRAIFYLNALNWAVNSDNPQKNLNELIEGWNKNRGSNT